MTTPPSRSPRAWNGEGEVLGVVPLLGAQGRKEEAKVSLVAPEDVGVCVCLLFVFFFDFIGINYAV